MEIGRRVNQQPSAKRPARAASVREAHPGKTASSAAPPVSEAMVDVIEASATVSLAAPTRDELLAVAERVRSAFPHAVDEAELVLIDVDPRHLHAFWTVPFDEAERVLARLDGEAASAPMVLRVCSVGDDGALAEPFDIEVLGLHGQFYVDVWESPRRYRATLGYRLADGTLVALAASNVAALPPLGPADDRTWREIALPPPAAPVSRATTAAAPWAPPPASAARGQADLPRAEDATPAASPGETLEARIAALTPAEPAAAGSPPTEAALPAEAHLLAAGGDDPGNAARAEGIASGTGSGGAPAATAAAEAPASPAAETPAFPSSAPAPLEPAPPPHPAAWPPGEAHMRPAAEAAASEGWRPSAPFPMPPVEESDHRSELGAGGGAGFERPFWEMPAAAAPDDAPGGGPADAPAPTPFAGEPAATAEAAHGPPGASEEGPPLLPLPLENVLSLSSFVFGRDPVELEVNAELHVFGRVKPGSRLQLFGREVRVRPDGTFSVHRPLGSGAAIMPVLMTEEDEAGTAKDQPGGPVGGRDEDAGEPG